MKHIVVMIFSVLIIAFFVEVKFLKLLEGEAPNEIYTQSGYFYPLLILPLGVFVFLPILSFLEDKINGNPIYLKFEDGKIYCKTSRDSETHIINYDEDKQASPSEKFKKLEDATKKAFKIALKGNYSLRPLVFFSLGDEMTAERIVFVRDAIMSAGAYEAEARFTESYDHVS